MRELNQQAFPDCFLYSLGSRRDVARVEHLTYICTRSKDDAGPNNNWMDPAEAKAKMRELFRGCMKGRTLYVVPYCMGPLDSPYARCGVEITDSAYVVLNMAIMTRMGRAALERIATDGDHSCADCTRPAISIPRAASSCIFPRSSRSRASAPATAAMRCSARNATRCALPAGRRAIEGWLAEHMLIVGLQNPRGETHYVAAAFPSACGKTNLAMLIPPESLPGWKVFTIGDDIAWLQPGPGRPAVGHQSGGGLLRGRPRHQRQDQSQCLRDDPPRHAVHQRRADGRQRALVGGPHRGPAGDRLARAARTIRRTDPRRTRMRASRSPPPQNPAYTSAAEDPRGVPISALIFGGRRRELAPLVYEARNWSHGVLVGASVASETTAAATGKVGVVRRDPMAMKPFCGYNFGDYWAHWLKVGAKLKSPPRIFHVNWFRQNAAGKFLWPGFGENLRVLAWMLDRCSGRVEARRHADRLHAAAVPISNTHGPRHQRPRRWPSSTRCRRRAWRQEIARPAQYLQGFGARLPGAMLAELDEVSRRSSRNRLLTAD